jgi:hypothetical protein
MSSSSLQFKPMKKEERLKQFIKLALPFFKPNFVNRPDLDSLYEILASNGQDNDRSDLKNTSKSKSNPFVCLNGNYFEVYQRSEIFKTHFKGHLKFAKKRCLTDSKVF